MCIIQFKYQCNYVVFQATCQAGVDIGAEILCFQEQYISERSMIHPASEICINLVSEPHQKRAAIGVKKDLDCRVVIESRSDLVDHPYTQVIDI